LRLFVGVVGVKGVDGVVGVAVVVGIEGLESVVRNDGVVCLLELLESMELTL
jgi:hypothetical protein